ncbi:unnamed protein product [Lampetra planeri]
MSLSNQSPQRDIGKDELTRAPSTACCWSDAMEDPSEIKRRIVRALCHSARALREEQAAWAEGPVDGEDARGLALCSALEAALVHGLRPHLLRAEQAWLPLWRWWAPGLPAAPLPNPHFWPVLGAVTHSNVMEQLTSLKFVRTDVGRCRAWLRVALNDGLLACYVDSLLCDAAALADWYERGALLLDAEQSPALLAALQGLDSVRFQLSYRSAALDQWTPGPLALAGLCPAEESPRETAHAEPSVALGSTDGKDGDAGGRRPPVGSPEAERSHPKKKAKKPKKTALGVLFEDPKGAKEMPCKSKSAPDANTVNAGKPGHAKAGPNQSSSDCSRENKNVSFCKEPCPDLKGNLGSDRESRISLPEIQISHITQGDFTKRSGQDENTTADPPSQSPRGTSVVVEGDNSDNNTVDSSRSPNLISAAVSNIAKASGCLPTSDSSDDDFYGHYPDGSGEAEPLGGPSGARISRTSATRKSRKVTRRRKELGPTKAAARAGGMAVPAAVAALLQDVPNRHQGSRSSCSSIDDDDIMVVVHRKSHGGAEDPFGGVRKMGLLLKRRRMKTWKEYFCELTASELRLYLPDGRAADNPAPPPSPVDPAAPAGEAARPFDGAPGERPGHGAVAVSLNDGYVLHKAYSLRLCQSVALLGLAKLSVYAAPADCLELSFAGHKLFFQAGSADDAEDWVERLREVLHEMGHRAVDE